ncbi:MAG: IS21 family transposase [Nitrospira sp.]|nr:IS21 family transposase [Nitrospira sp.]
MITQQQYKRLMSEYEKTGKISVSAMKADMDRQTARKYIQAGECPAQQQVKHTWRTRPDPLEKVWPEVVRMLRDAPELEAKTLFEYFLARPDSGLEETHLRTFFRRVRHWRATEGPEREVFFAQERKPGQLMQLDWTYARELQVTIQGQLLDHLLCQCVLPYSDWQWATRCISESFLSLVGGLQAALEQLRKCPECLGTDNSSAATHELESAPGRSRGYNADYLELCTHYDLTPVTINVNCPHEHGDVESLNRHLKRRLEQHLILRGSRDFASLEEYDQFVQEVLKAANAKRQKRLAEELAVMRPLAAGRLAEYREYEPVVSSQSLIRVNKHTYSVPSRLIGHTLRVEQHEAELKVYLGREFLFCLPRLRGDRGALVDFRHVITPLLRKPGAFIHYRHREALYPSTVYRAAYDRLVTDHGERPGVIEYLHLLKLATEETVEKVEAALVEPLAGSAKWRAVQVREQLAPTARKVIELAGLTPSLQAYDTLLESEVAHVG